MGAPEEHRSAFDTLSVITLSGMALYNLVAKGNDGFPTKEYSAGGASLSLVWFEGLL